MELNQIYNTDALEGLKQLDENSIRFIGFEREEEYYKIAPERIKHYQKQAVL